MERFMVNGILSGEIICRIGIAMMGLSVFSGIFCMILFGVTGRRLKERLTKEYGRPYK